MSKAGEPNDKAFVAEMSYTLFNKQNYEMPPEFWSGDPSEMVHTSNHGARQDG